MPQSPPQHGRPVQVIAHRGASRAAPENTVAAFRRAAEMGAQAVELDVRRTGDGALVVHHDAASRPTAVRSASSPAPTSPTHVPAFAAALDACAGMWVNVEIKNDPRRTRLRPDRFDRRQDDRRARWPAASRSAG